MAGGDDLVFRLVVSDDDPVNLLSLLPDQATINFRSINDLPSCDLAFAAPSSLWVSNCKMKALEIARLMDADSLCSTARLAITGMTQDEPANGLGDGDSSPMR